MDRVVLSNADIEAILAWRDEHYDLVRMNPVPLRSVEIVCKDSGYAIKGIRDGGDLKLYLSQNGISLGHIELAMRFDGMWIQKKSRMDATKEMVQSMLTVYCSTMAIMVDAPASGKVGNDPPEKATPRSKKQGTKKPAKRTTYIIRKTKNGIYALPRGSHTSPAGEFSVRGHFRHYKNGRTIWIAEYRKGTGKKKRKTYKLGGEKE